MGAYSLENHISIRVCDRAVLPDANLKMTNVLYQACDIKPDENYVWKYFKLAGAERSSIFFLMLIKKSSKTKSLRAHFMARVVRKAGKKCTGRSTHTNLGHFYEFDYNKILNIFTEDWAQLAQFIDEILSTSNFLEEKEIKKYFFYCTYDTWYDQWYKEMQNFIKLCRIHIFTNYFVFPIHHISCIPLHIRSYSFVWIKIKYYILLYFSGTPWCTKPSARWCR